MNNKIDLHGVRHQDVEILVEEFVLLNETPIEIITGNSVQMKNIVKEVLNRHGFKFLDGDLWNRGKIVVLS